MFKSRIFAGAMENSYQKLKLQGNLRHTHYFFMVLWDGRSCKEMRGKFLRTESNNWAVVQSRDAMLGWPSFLRRRKWLCWRICSQIVLKCMYLARIGRPDILWSVNKLAPAVTKWTKACDKLVRWSRTFITQVNLGNIVMWVTPHNNAE